MMLTDGFRSDLLSDEGTDDCRQQPEGWSCLNCFVGHLNTFRTY